MSKLHIFIDGSWLYKAGGPELVLASKMENQHQGIKVDFSRLNQTLLKYVQKHNPDCSELGDKYIATSIFSIPSDFDSWPDEYDNILPIHIEHIEHIKPGLASREIFVQSALAAGYSEQAIYRPPIKSWIIEKLIQKKYQEKQVDTTVVALLVRSAIINPKDYHCVITGDSDILPAIRVAYPQYSENVFVATTHPDELRAEHRQTAFSIHNFDFRIPPLYLQDYVSEIIHGDYIYTCAHCNKIFVRPKPIPNPRKSRPCCTVCHTKRT